MLDKIEGFYLTLYKRINLFQKELIFFAKILNSLSIAFAEMRKTSFQNESFKNQFFSMRPNRVRILARFKPYSKVTVDFFRSN